MTEKKTWTVLIYANRNNDLDVSIYSQFQLLKDTVLTENINVIIQISGPQQQQSRGGNISLDNEPSVCRYKIIDNTAFLIEDLGKTSMAKPQTFLHFLLWGKGKFPSEHLMIILSGHGFGFVGFMGDQHEKAIYLMSIQGFAKALSQFWQETHKTIDLLVFDTCYMNLIEVLYEITVVSDDAVRCVLLPQNNPSLEGLHWPTIIYGLEPDTRMKKTIDTASTNVVKSFNRIYNGNDALFAIRMIQSCFEKLKMYTDQLAGLILQKGIITEESFGFLPEFTDNDFISFISLLYWLNNKVYDTQKLNAEIFKTLDEIHLYPELNEIKKYPNPGLCVYLPDTPKQYSQYKKYHEILLFLQNNRWQRILPMLCS